MVKTLLLASALALPLAVTAPAVAQDQAPGPGTLAERIGDTVYSPTGEPLGELTDVVQDRGGAHRAIISFGGVLGVGDTEVAVPPAELSVQPGGEAGQPRLVVSMGQDELEAMPEYDPQQEQVAGSLPQPSQPDQSSAPAAPDDATTTTTTTTAAEDGTALGGEAEAAVSEALARVEQAWTEVETATADGWHAARANFAQAVADLERTWQDVTAGEQQAQQPDRAPEAPVAD